MADVIKNVKVRFIKDTSDLDEVPNSFFKITKAEKEATDQLKKLDAEARETNKHIQDDAKESAKEIGNANNKIQDSSKSFQGLRGAVSGVTDEVKQAAGNMDIFGVNVGKSFGLLKTGLTSGTAGFNILKIAIASTGIGALIIAAGSLITYFSKTEKGAESLERFMAALGAVIGVVAGRVARLGEGLFKIITLNFKEGADLISGAFGNIGEEIEKARISALQYTTTLQDVEDDYKNLEVEIARVENRVRALDLAGRNQAKSFKERFDIYKQASDLEDGITNKQIALIDKKIKALEKENKLALERGEIDEGNQLDSLRDALLERERLIGQQAENEQRRQNRISSLEIKAEKAKGKELRDVQKAALDDVNKNAEHERVVTEEKNAEILNSTEETNDLIAQSYKELNDGITDEQARALNAQLQDYERFNKNKTKSDEERRREREEIERSAVQTLTGIGNSFFEISSNRRDKELNDLDARYNQEIKLAGENEQQKAIVEARFAAEERKIKRQQAQADKNQALFNAGINTAVAITKAAPNPVLIALAAALGAAQLAVIASRPIPAFAKGTKSVPGINRGYDSVLAMLQPEEAVIPVNKKRKYEPIINGIIDGTLDPRLNNFALDHDRIGKSIPTPDNSDVILELKSIKKALANQKHIGLSFSERGFEKFIHSSNSKTDFLNDRIDV